MSDSQITNIDPSKEYSTGEAAALIGLSAKQVGRLVDANVFPNAGRRSPLEGSHRYIPGQDLIDYMKRN